MFDLPDILTSEWQCSCTTDCTERNVRKHERHERNGTMGERTREEASVLQWSMTKKATRALAPVPQEAFPPSTIWTARQEGDSRRPNGDCTWIYVLNFEWCNGAFWTCYHYKNSPLLICIALIAFLSMKFPHPVNYDSNISVVDRGY